VIAKDRRHDDRDNDVKLKKVSFAIFFFVCTVYHVSISVLFRKKKFLEDFVQKKVKFGGGKCCYFVILIFPWEEEDSGNWENSFFHCSHT